MSYKSFSFGLLGIAAGAFLTGALQFVVAWTAPTATAPGGNVSAPINVSGTAQIKTGPLMANLPIGTPLFPGAGLQVGGVAYVGQLVSVDQIKVGNTGLPCTSGNAGAIKWTGTAMEYCNEKVWGPLGGGGGDGGTYQYGGVYSRDYCQSSGNMTNPYTGGYSCPSTYKVRTTYVHQGGVCVQFFFCYK